MGKRIERIFPDNFIDKLPQIIGYQLTVINNQGKTFKGILQQFETSKLNLKVKTHKFIDIEVDNIAELQIDRVSNW